MKFESLKLLLFYFVSLNFATLPHVWRSNAQYWISNCFSNGDRYIGISISELARITLIFHYSFVFPHAVTANLPNRHRTQLLCYVCRKYLDELFTFLLTSNSIYVYLDTYNPHPALSLWNSWPCAHPTPRQPHIRRTGMRNRISYVRCESHRSFCGCRVVQNEFNSKHADSMRLVCHQRTTASRKNFQLRQSLSEIVQFVCWLFCWRKINFISKSICRQLFWLVQCQFRSVHCESKHIYKYFRNNKTSSHSNIFHTFRIYFGNGASEWCEMHSINESWCINARNKDTANIKRLGAVCTLRCPCESSEWQWNENQNIEKKNK